MSGYVAVVDTVPEHKRANRHEYDAMQDRMTGEGVTSGRVCLCSTVMQERDATGFHLFATPDNIYLLPMLPARGI